MFQASPLHLLPSAEPRADNAGAGETVGPWAKLVKQTDTLTVFSQLLVPTPAPGSLAWHSHHPFLSAALLALPACGVIQPLEDGVGVESASFPDSPFWGIDL